MFHCKKNWTQPLGDVLSLIIFLWWKFWWKGFVNLIVASAFITNFSDLLDLICSLQDLTRKTEINQRNSLCANQYLGT